MKEFGIGVIRLVESLPPGMVSGVLGKQLVRCATSVGANYRAACRAKSPADFIAKLAIVEEEGDEAMYWLELLRDTGKAPADSIEPLLREADEIVAIVVASIRTARARQQK